MFARCSLLSLSKSYRPTVKEERKKNANDHTVSLYSRFNVDSIVRRDRKRSPSSKDFCWCVFHSLHFLRGILGAISRPWTLLHHHPSWKYRLSTTISIFSFPDESVMSRFLSVMSVTKQKSATTVFYTPPFLIVLLIENPILYRSLRWRREGSQDVMRTVLMWKLHYDRLHTYCGTSSFDY